MGKTSIIKKMVDECPESGLYIYQDLEGVNSELEFVEKILSRLDGELSRLAQAGLKLRQLVQELGGAEIAGAFRLPEAQARNWKLVLDRILRDLMEHHTGPIVFFWDEMPLMLHNISRRSNSEAAMEILDHLRALRQSHPRLRMVYTGSVGLHNVVASLRRAGHANDATNDMFIQDVPPLSEVAATQLALQLIDGERLSASPDAKTCAARIARAVNGMPYFIHHVIDSLAHDGGAVDSATIDRVVTARLTDARDAWHLRYYDERLKTYYAPDERAIAYAILDTLAVTSEPLTIADTLNRVRACVVTNDDELMRHVIVLIQQDHYVTQLPNGALRFRFDLIKRFWALHRGVAA